MKKSEINKLTKVAEDEDWSVSISGNEFEFSKYSPAGQEFNISLTANTLRELADELSDRCDDFDCSEEAYAWLDDTGHGANGAPYDMKDVYEDMEACEGMLLDFMAAVHKIL